MSALRGLLYVAVAWLASGAPGQPAATQTPLVPSGAVWRYLDDGSDPGPEWTGPGFDESGWAAGPAELGFGDRDEATALEGGPLTFYFRHRFSAADPEALGGLALSLLRDDGAVVYLNGLEVHRSNLPDGDVEPDTLASENVSGAEEQSWEVVSLPACRLVPGENWLAVEVHQASPSSGDLSFDLRLEASPPPSPPLLLRPPYLQRVTPTGAVLRWRTDRAVPSRVRHGPAPDALAAPASGAACTTEHEVELAGLATASRTYYGLEAAGELFAGGDADHWVETSPLPGTRAPLRIWVLGDSGDCAVSEGGCENVAAVQQAYLGLVGERLADVWLMLGDNAYSRGTDAEYTAGLFAPFARILRNTPLWPAPGNHEFGASDSPTQSGPYYEAFTLPTQGEAGGVPSGTEAYYSFDHGNVHFISLDSVDTDRSVGGPMHGWLEADLAANRQDWTIAYWHHPPYTKSSHDSDDPEDSEGRMIEVRERFLALLEAYGVDLQLAGHSHSYERSVLLDGHYGFSSSYDPTLHALDPGDGDPESDGAYAKPGPGPAAHEGAVYAVVGSSSKNSRELGAHPVMTVGVDYEGSLLVDVDGGQLDALFLDKDGLVRDRFRIVKPVPEPSGRLLGLVALVTVCGLRGARRPRPADAGPE
jgi:hypothetical protein